MKSLKVILLLVGIGCGPWWVSQPANAGTVQSDRVVTPAGTLIIPDLPGWEPADFGTGVFVTDPSVFGTVVGLTEGPFGPLSDLIYVDPNHEVRFASADDNGVFSVATLLAAGTPTIQLPETGALQDLGFAYFLPKGILLVQSDVETTTPLPAALPLMGSILGTGYLVSAWRRRRGNGSAAIAAA